jgi:hypothetical protein
MPRIALALTASLVAACDSSPESCDPDEPRTICTIAGNGEEINAPAVVAALDATFDQPMDVAVAPDGSLWISAATAWSVS